MFAATYTGGSANFYAVALHYGIMRITKLSEDLGFKLFEKSGRGLRLTAAWETLNLTLGRFFTEWRQPSKACELPTLSKTPWFSPANPR